LIQFISITLCNCRFSRANLEPFSTAIEHMLYRHIECSELAIFRGKQRSYAFVIRSRAPKWPSDGQSCHLFDSVRSARVRGFLVSRTAYLANATKRISVLPNRLPVAVCPLRLLNAGVLHLGVGESRSKRTERGQP